MNTNRKKYHCCPKAWFSANLDSSVKKYNLSPLQWITFVVITVFLLLTPPYMRYKNLHGFSDEMFRGEAVPLVFDMYSILNSLTLLALAITFLGYVSSRQQTKVSEQQVTFLTAEVKLLTETKPLENTGLVVEKVAEIISRAEQGDSLYFVAATITIGYTGSSDDKQYENYIAKLRQTVSLLQKSFNAICFDGRKILGNATVSPIEITSIPTEFKMFYNKRGIIDQEQLARVARETRLRSEELFPLISFAQSKEGNLEYWLELLSPHFVVLKGTPSSRNEAVIWNINRSVSDSGIKSIGYWTKNDHIIKMVETMFTELKQ